MNIEAWTATAISIVALIFTGIAAVSAWRQTAHQKQIHKESMQPYIWVDVRNDDSQGQLLQLIVGNSGPTVAQKVRVTVDPPLPADKARKFDSETAARRLKQGIGSLPPGKTFAWGLGISGKILREEGLPPYTITIDAEGHFGRVPTLSYIIDLDAIRETADNPAGSLHRVREAIDSLALRLPRAPNMTHFPVRVHATEVRDEPTSGAVRPNQIKR